jgi:hypothetical protein
MSNLKLMLPLQNESTSPLKLYLEPLSEYFMLRPSQKVEVHAIFDDQTKNLNFTVATNDTFLTIYAPGEMSGFIDCFVTCDGIRLEADGN